MGSIIIITSATVTIAEINSQTIEIHQTFNMRIVGKFSMFQANTLQLLGVSNHTSQLHQSRFQLHSYRLKQSTCSWKGYLERLLNWKVLCQKRLFNLTIFHVKIRTQKLSNLGLPNFTMFQLPFPFIIHAYIYTSMPIKKNATNQRKPYHPIPLQNVSFKISEQVNVRYVFLIVFQLDIL